MKYTKTFAEALKDVKKIVEDGHTDTASAVRQCKTTIEDASQMLSKLQSMNPEDSLPSWWMNKIAIAANSMNKLRDYLLVPSTNEDFDKINRDRSKGSRHVAKGDDKDKGTIEDMKRQIQMLKIELENEKNKTVKPEPNPDTGEVPLRTGVAQAILDKSTPQPPVDSEKKKKIKVGGKTEIKVNPDTNVGQYSGGIKVNTTNLG
tara:strand:- start:6487 stop:7098 length:612 start_codon:yes stop_codon:yes gene_type:complete